LALTQTKVSLLGFPFFYLQNAVSSIRFLLVLFLDKTELLSLPAANKGSFTRYMSYGLLKTYPLCSVTDAPKPQPVKTAQIVTEGS
jgi:hypothetical protein